MNFKQCKFVIWNCIRVSSKVFLQVSKNYIRESQPDIFIVLETRDDTRKVCKKFNQVGFNGYNYTYVRDIFGCIAMAWK